MVLLENSPLIHNRRREPRELFKLLSSVSRKIRPSESEYLQKTATATDETEYELPLEQTPNKTKQSIMADCSPSNTMHGERPQYPLPHTGVSYLHLSRDERMDSNI